MRSYCSHSSTSHGSVRFSALGDHSFILRVCQGTIVPLLHLEDYFELQNDACYKTVFVDFLVACNGC